MNEKCIWCAGLGVKFRDICMACAGAGGKSPNPRLIEVTFTVQADELVLTRDFLGKIDHSLIYAFTDSMEDAGRIESALADLRESLGRIQLKLADFDLDFSESYPLPPRG